MAFAYTVDVNDPQQSGLINSFDAPGLAIVPDEVCNDRHMAISIRPVVAATAPNSLRPWNDDNLASDTYQYAIGNVDEPPTSGEFVLDVGGFTTGMTAIDWDESEAAFQTAIGAGLTAYGHTGGVIATKIGNGIYQWTANTVGAIPQFTSPSNTLKPYAIVSITVVEAGDGSTQASQIVELKQGVVAYSQPSTQFPVASVTVDTQQMGDGTHNKIQSITITLGMYGGTYSVNVTKVGPVTVTAGVAAWDITADQMAALLINGTGLISTDVNVTKTNGIIYVEFKGTQKLSDVPALTTSNIDLMAPSGVSGFVNLNTYAMFYAFAASPSADTLTFTKEIRRTRATGEERAIYLGSVTVKRNLIQVSTLVPVPVPTYITIEDVGYLIPAWRMDITDLTGGSSNDLDSILTIDMAVGYLVFISWNGLSAFELVAGTDAESAPTTVRPDDYAGGNHKVWKQRL